MWRYLLLFSSLLVSGGILSAQVNINKSQGILFRGLIQDASSLSPVPNSQIFINNNLAAVSNEEGSFVFYVSREDTVVFNSLGYKSFIFIVSDTLRGSEFNAGIFLHTDTVEIGEVIILPRRPDLRSEIMNAPPRESGIMDNARSNVAISAYQGRTSQAQLGDPVDNYAALRQKQKVMAFERGGIPSDQIAGLNPLLIVPAAWLLIKGFPEKPSPLKSQLTSSEVDEIHRIYLERNRRKE